MKRYKGLIVSGIVVIGMWILSWVLIQNYYGTGTDDGRGTFGDMFGAVNSLFSGLAFAGIIYTIIMQRKDLELQAASIKLQTKAIEMQTEELGLMKEETARMADELEGQRRLMNMQRIESTVFYMISSINEFSLKIVYGNNEQKQEGATAIKNILINMKYHESKNLKSKIDESSWGQLSAIEKYTKAIIYTLHFINEADIDENSKKMFADILSINLEDVEVLLLYEYYHQEQHELSLLHSYGFKIRYDEISKESLD